MQVVKELKTMLHSTVSEKGTFDGSYRKFRRAIVGQGNHEILWNRKVKVGQTYQAINSKTLSYSKKSIYDLRIIELFS